VSSIRPDQRDWVKSAPLFEFSIRRSAAEQRDARRLPLDAIPYGCGAAADVQRQGNRHFQIFTAIFAALRDTRRVNITNRRDSLKRGARRSCSSRSTQRHGARHTCHPEEDQRKAYTPALAPRPGGRISTSGLIVEVGGPVETSEECWHRSAMFNRQSMSLTCTRVLPHMEQRGK
jgi:hypothetical protein